jgi:hypothetical protein
MKLGPVKAMMTPLKSLITEISILRGCACTHGGSRFIIRRAASGWSLLRHFQTRSLDSLTRCENSHIFNHTRPFLSVAPRVMYHKTRDESDVPLEISSRASRAK